MIDENTNASGGDQTPPPTRIDISERYKRGKRGRSKTGEEGRVNAYFSELERTSQWQQEQQQLVNEEAKKSPVTRDELISFHVQNALAKIERPRNRSSWKHGLKTQNFYMQTDFEATRKHLQEDSNPGNFLSATAHLLNIAPALFREAYIYNSKTSAPTFYRQMRPAYMDYEGRRVKVVENLSYMQKDLIKQVFEQLLVYLDNEFRILVAKSQ